MRVVVRACGPYSVTMRVTVENRPGSRCSAAVRAARGGVGVGGDQRLARGPRLRPHGHLGRGDAGLRRRQQGAAPARPLTAAGPMAPGSLNGTCASTTAQAAAGLTGASSTRSARTQPWPDGGPELRIARGSDREGNGFVPGGKVISATRCRASAAALDGSGLDEPVPGETAPAAPPDAAGPVERAAGLTGPAAAEPQRPAPAPPRRHRAMIEWATIHGRLPVTRFPSDVRAAVTVARGTGQPRGRSDLGS